jgi:hypothetical protein
VRFLETQLLDFTQKNSYGIVQGVYPSDLIGNYYLCVVDAQHKIEGLEFTRYVDDMYIFFESEVEALYHQLELGSWLRKDSLYFNESKTKIYKVDELLREENEIDDLFHEVIDEMTTFNPYDEQVMLGDSEIEPDEVNDLATKSLFLTKTDSKKLRTKIDKFCLPIFGALNDTSAVPYVLENFARMPHLAKVYCNYFHILGKNDDSFVNEIEKLLLQPNIIFEYQKLWILSLLLKLGGVTDKTLDQAYGILKTPNSQISIRAICSIIIGKYGKPSQKRLLRNHYSDETSEYVRGEILYASQYLSNDEKNSCFNAWAGHSELNSLIVSAIRLKNKAG